MWTMYLIHWPVRAKKGENPLEYSKGDLLPFDIYTTWKAMEHCYELNLAKSIGVCNFSCAKLKQILQHGTIVPAVNQVEINVAWQQQKMLAFGRANGIHISAWSPLGANGALGGSHRVMRSPVLKNIAIAKNKTIAQIAVRWIYEQGASVIVKSFDKERMRQNIRIFDWELTEEETEQILKIPQSRGFKGECFVDENGPIKSLEELWDGEL